MESRWNKSFKNKFFNEYLGSIYANVCGIFIIILTLTIIGFIFVNGSRTFIENGHSVFQFLFSSNWAPEGKPPSFGALIFIVGSICVSLGAIILSTPFAISLAIFMNVISDKLGKTILQPAIEIFVGIPSVVYGWLGITVLIPLLKKVIGGYGFSLLAGIIVLAIMILPTITSISSDAIKNIPRDYQEASYGLGATRWQTIIKVILPSAKVGISSGVVLGLARAFGEALAVQMVIGNSLSFPKSLLSPTSTITGAITMDMGNTVKGSAYNNSLWSLGLLLLIMSFLFILLIRVISKRGEIK